MSHMYLSLFTLGGQIKLLLLLVSPLGKRPTEVCASKGILLIQCSLGLRLSPAGVSTEFFTFSIGFTILGLFVAYLSSLSSFLCPILDSG